MPSRVPAFDEIRQSEIDKFLSRLLAARLRLAPIGLAVLLAFAWHDSRPWRLYGLLGFFGFFTVVQMLTLREFRHGRSSSNMVALNLGLLSIALVAGMAFTGGADSPIGLVVGFLGATLSLTVSGPMAAISIVTCLLGIAALAAVQVSGWFPHAMPDIFGGGAYAGTRALFLTRSFCLAWVLLVGFFVNRRVRALVDGAGRLSNRVRDEALADHAEQMRTLTTVAGEIAHELKNPLASIKGLASLVARELTGPGQQKSAEQMAVLRREVERMQGVLDEFLNFSRPLLPLNLKEVELGELCDDVLKLYETVATERALRLDLRRYHDVRVRADGRKLKQVLINLVQNALDATPAGGRVELQVDAPLSGATAARVRVVDDGPGLSPELLARAFDAGVTTKASGSGLGLTLSRALMRQHGGELTLFSSVGGGCVAELTLPREAHT
jgi:signal transduction histidine kinase